MKDITISRRSLLVSAGLLALAPLAGCGGNSGSGSAAAGSDYTIGVLQLTEHSALDAANDGFVKAIKKSGLKVIIFHFFNFLSCCTKNFPVISGNRLSSTIL